jgi:hypothetical protein
MDQNALHRINESFASIAVLLEDLQPELLEPVDSFRIAVTRLERVVGLIEAIRTMTRNTERKLAPAS